MMQKGKGNSEQKGIGNSEDPDQIASLAIKKDSILTIFIGIGMGEEL